MQRLRLFGREAALALQIFTEASRADGEVAREQRNAVVENVDVGDVVADVQQADDAVHRIRVVELEGVVQRERFDVDDGRLEARVGEHAHFRFDQFALRGDEQDAHLEAVGVGIENLEIQLDRLHVERNVLLGFPAHQLARLLLLDALYLNFLDDDVAAADGGDDRLRRHTRFGERGLNRFGNDARVHHFAFDDRVGEQRRDRHANELWLALRMIDDSDLDQARADVETDGCLFPTEQGHGNRG